MIGKTLGHYRVLAQLGKGGMAEVYRARDTRLDRDVALKVLPADPTNDPDRRVRFEREARAVAALTHPGIVTIHAVEEIDGVYFLAMELVEGQTLAEAIPSGGLSLERFFQYAIPLADALSFAHEKGITHRDLKPSNVMIDASGRIRVLDFGLAKLLARPDRSDETTIVGDEHVTAEGHILGTMAYMSPEQAEGKPLDPRTDIFSLGIVLYEMATGERPFRGDTPISTVSAIHKDNPIPVTQRRAALPRHLGRVIGRCLEKKPEKRFQTARDVWNELEGLQKEVESGELTEVLSRTDLADISAAAAARVRSGGGWRWVAAAVVVVGLAALTVWQLRGPGTVAPARELTTRPLTSLIGTEAAGAWSPDGSFVAYSHSSNGPANISLVAAGGGESIRLVDSPGDDILPRWSPDNRFIAFVSNRDGTPSIYLVAPLGGAVRKLAEIGGATLSDFQSGALGVTPWTPDGRAVLFSRFAEDGSSFSVWRIDIESGVETQVTHPEAGEFDGMAAFSFGGDRILFIRSTPAGSRLLEAGVDGSDPRERIADPALYLMPAWAADGSIVFAKPTGGLWVLDPGAARPRQLTAGSINEVEPVVSRGGRILYSTASHQTDLFLQDLDGSGEKRLTAHTLDNFVPRISADGKSVLYASSRTGDFELWILDMETGTERRLTNREGHDGDGDWSPDMREIAYNSERAGASELWIMGVDGGNARKLADGVAGRPIRFTPDGTGIAFRTQGPRGTNLSVVDRRTGEMRTVMEGVADFDWYGDGSSLIYTASDAPREIRARELASGREVVLVDEPHTEIVVADDGSAITYCSAASHYNMNLHLVRLRPPGADGGPPTAAGPPEKITHGEGSWHVHNGGFSPDGRRVVFTRDTDTGDVFVLDGAF